MTTTTSTQSVKAANQPFNFTAVEIETEPPPPVDPFRSLLAKMRPGNAVVLESKIAKCLEKTARQLGAATTSIVLNKSQTRVYLDKSPIERYDASDLVREWSVLYFASGRTHWMGTAHSLLSDLKSCTALDKNKWRVDQLTTRVLGKLLTAMSRQPNSQISLVWERRRGNVFRIAPPPILVGQPLSNSAPSTNHE